MCLYLHNTAARLSEKMVSVSELRRDGQEHVRDDLGHPRCRRAVPESGAFTETKVRQACRRRPLLTGCSSSQTCQRCSASGQGDTTAHRAPVALVLRLRRGADAEHDGERGHLLSRWCGSHKECGVRSSFPGSDVLDLGSNERSSRAHELLPFRRC